MFAEKFDAARDVFLSYGVLDVLDHSSPTPLMGAKIGIDLTTPRKEEPQRKASNLKIADDRRLGEIRNFIREDACFKNCEFLPYFAAFSIEKGEQNGRQILHKLANSKLFDGYFRAAIIFDADIDISNKSKNGRELKAQELPGLWNGSMARWNTVFVEVLPATFSPVKVVTDLLRDQHQ